MTLTPYQWRFISALAIFVSMILIGCRYLPLRIVEAPPPSHPIIHHEQQRQIRKPPVEAVAFPKRILNVTVSETLFTKYATIRTVAHLKRDNDSHIEFVARIKYSTDAYKVSSFYDKSHIRESVEAYVAYLGSVDSLDVLVDLGDDERPVPNKEYEARDVTESWTEWGELVLFLFPIVCAFCWAAVKVWLEEQKTYTSCSALRW